tara:strand:- start:2592 stop:3119 length:528 start_codon:yes stop_codon:yes gene_type:complete
MSNLEQNLIDNFGSYKDFPKPGIVFCDILPILRKPELFNELIKEMSNSKSVQESEALLAIDARGFIFGTALAQLTKKPVVLARKPGKLPGETIEASYDLEYGKNTLCIQKSSIDPFESFSIIDDLLATGGTAACVEKMLLSSNKKVKSLSVVVELPFLNGRKSLDCEVNSVVKLD